MVAGTGIKDISQKQTSLIDNKVRYKTRMMRVFGIWIKHQSKGQEKSYIMYQAIWVTDAIGNQDISTMNQLPIDNTIWCKIQTTHANGTWMKTQMSDRAKQRSKHL